MPSSGLWGCIAGNVGAPPTRPPSAATAACPLRLTPFSMDGYPPPLRLQCSVHPVPLFQPSLQPPPPPPGAMTYSGIELPSPPPPPPPQPAHLVDLCLQRLELHGRGDGGGVHSALVGQVVEHVVGRLCGLQGLVQKSVEGVARIGTENCSEVDSRGWGVAEGEGGRESGRRVEAGCRAKEGGSGKGARSPI